jgi:hypothetical protein
VIGRLIGDDDDDRLVSWKADGGWTCLRPMMMMMMMMKGDEMEELGFSIRSVDFVHGVDYLLILFIYSSIHLSTTHITHQTKAPRAVYPLPMKTLFIARDLEPLSSPSSSSTSSTFHVPTD